MFAFTHLYRLLARSVFEISQLIFLAKGATLVTCQPDMSSRDVEPGLPDSLCDFCADKATLASIPRKPSICHAKFNG